jgi:hypothetical protein
MSNNKYSVGFPFSHENVSKDTFIRKFSKNVSKDELVWHRDKEDREIEIISGEGWSFQRENSLPIKLSIGDKVLIKKNEWHRIIKGSEDLVLLIKHL